MNVPAAEAWLDAVVFDDNGLVPAIAQDAQTGRILMFAFMNRESLALTRETGFATYWSRSRNRLWKKGEESGHRQQVRAMRLDCDGDVVLLEIEQDGGIACHTGRESCFYRELQGEGEHPDWVVTDPVLKDPKAIYR